MLPNYLDGQSLVVLIPRILGVLRRNFPGVQSRILVINDNWQPDSSLILRDWPQDFESVEIIELNKNIGNQRAIIFGLSIIEQNCLDDDLIIVMDSDGEDLPEDIPQLVTPLQTYGKQISLASRGHRTANLKFAIGLKLFSWFFKFLTGAKWNTGNFSCFTGRWIKAYLDELEQSGNFAGFIRYKADGDETVSINRGKRIVGSTRTSLAALINHAIECLLIWHREMRIRALLFFASNLIFLFFTILIGLAFRLGPYQSSPNWITMTFFGSATLTLLALSLFLSALIISIARNKS